MNKAIRDIHVQGAKTLTDVAIDEDGALIAAANTRRLAVWIRNAGPNTVYIGPAGVTAASGMPLASGAAHLDEVSNDAWYAIAAAAESATVWVLDFLA